MNQLQQGNSSHAGLWPWIFFFFYYKHPRHADWIMWRSSSSDAEFRIWLIWASGSLLGSRAEGVPRRSEQACAVAGAPAQKWQH